MVTSSSQGGTAYRGVKMKEDILIPPTGGWSAATMYIAVNPNAEAMKRKREEEVRSKFNTKANYGEFALVATPGSHSTRTFSLYDEKVLSFL